MNMESLPHVVIEKLGWYVYLYIDPHNKEVFYVGKGKGNRALYHLNDQKDTEKVNRIKEIRSKGSDPRIEILAHGLKDEEAVRIEAAAIDLLDIEYLTNEYRGHGSNDYGRLPLDELRLRYGAEDAKIIHPVLLIRIARLFQYGMSPEALYRVTRGVWDVDVGRAKKVKYALAVYEGIVREVYTVDTWGRADAIKDYWVPFQQKYARGRWAFCGEVADESIQEQYKGKSVKHHFPKFAQKAFRYVNI